MELAFQFVWDLANIQQPSVGRTDIVSKVLCVYIFIMVAFGMSLLFEHIMSTQYIYIAIVSY